MRTINRILLATDFSESARNAARIAAGIATSRKAELHILAVHVITPAQGPGPFAYGTERTIHEAVKTQLEDFDVGTDLKTIKALESGDHAAPAIVDYAREHAIDLIAIGTHSRGGLARFFLGSVASEVVRTASVPVLVTGPGQAAMPDDYKCIVAPVDFSEQSLEALREAAVIANIHDARLVALHVVDTTVLPSFPQSNVNYLSEEARNALASFIGKAKVSVPVEQIVTAGNVHTEIAELAEARGADLIVIGASGLGAVERFLLGSATNRVLRMAPCPVLVYRGDETTEL